MEPRFFLAETGFYYFQGSPGNPFSITKAIFGGNCPIFPAYVASLRRAEKIRSIPAQSLLFHYEKGFPGEPSLKRPTTYRYLFMIIVNTGNGKGKTTAAIGQAIRSLGRGWKVCIIQLFKGEEFYGEQKILKTLKNLDFYSFAPRHPFCFPDIKQSVVKEQCRKALACFEKLSRKDKYQLIIIEEFNIALREGYIKLKDLLKVLKNIDSNTNVIITGRGAPKELIERADLVTEMREIKHPFNQGIQAKKGIEF